MSGSRPYVLDANIFIEAHQRYYGFNICPGFWRALEKQHAEKRLCSIDKVKSELLAAKDRLSDWVQASVPKTFFKGTADKAVIDGFREMVKWVQSESQYTPEAKAEFPMPRTGGSSPTRRRTGIGVPSDVLPGLILDWKWPTFRATIATAKRPSPTPFVGALPSLGVCLPC